MGASAGPAVPGVRCRWTGLDLAGVASTIDNALTGTDVSIGATTAIDIAPESVDRPRVTAASQPRLVLVEVMGREAGCRSAGPARPYPP